jgi:hypothetical protein
MPPLVTHLAAAAERVRQVAEEALGAQPIPPTLRR